MKILGLYNNELALELFQALQKQGHEVILWKEKLSAFWCKEQEFDLAVSYTYRYFILEDVINVLHGNVVNLHNSYLPWNRGADPNLWSIVERTPRGVSLHYVNAGLDKGDIIAQKLVCDTDEETLESSYLNLHRAALELFQEAFGVYPYWQDMRKKALGKGSYHSLKDGEQMKTVIDSYAMSIKEFRGRLEKC